ncbi:glycosyltransferase family 2 protein [Paraburkholderia mimosarum]|uniref:glycosyltransferase family 2 protein n=1 Tax=Paraburkholderia mimosarum TaxID=312026 RepID=UPI001376E7ED|nr:glycosyltransferase [Paraburkholderia mimosarum]
MRKVVRTSTQQAGYQRWIETVDALEPTALRQLADEMAAWQQAPRISIVVPVYNTPAVYLDAMIESVRAQIYPHWELCLADDASSAPHVETLLRKHAQRDARIRVMRRAQNGHICAASNSALKLATGEYVALLDHDDLLPPHALAMVAKYLRAHPHARLLYSDEDKISSDGRRSTPYFKPDWDPELIVQYNFFSHLGVYETALIREVGGFREGFEGSQDHDLVLRCVRAAGDAAVVHIPHVLYHWRTIEGSTALDIDEKPYAVEAGVRAVRESLRLRDARVEAIAPSTQLPFVQVRYPLPEPLPRVQAILRCAGDGSAPQTALRALFARPQPLLTRVTLVGPGAATHVEYASKSAGEHAQGVTFDAQMDIEAALRADDAAFVCLLDAQVEAGDEGWLDALVRHALRPEIGLAGPRLSLPGGGAFVAGLVATSPYSTVLARSGASREDFGYFGMNQLTRTVTALPGACLVARRAVLSTAAAQLAAYDERDLDGEDSSVDLALARALGAQGLRHVLVAQATVVCAQDMPVPDAVAGLAAQAGFRDPAYSPHLAVENGVATFEIAEVPRISRFG